jgi:pectate lyase
MLCIFALTLVPFACSLGQGESIAAEAGFATAGTVTLEAESMSKSGYSNESNTSASGGKVVKLSGTNGSVTKNFSGITSSYNVSVTYVDQVSGTSTFTLSIAGTVIGTWAGDQATSSDLFLTKTFSGITVANGAQIKLAGTKDSSELAKFDIIVFTPAASSSSSVTSNSSSSKISSSISSTSSSIKSSSSSSKSSSAVSSTNSSITTTSDCIGWGAGTTGGTGGKTYYVTTKAELETAANLSETAIVVIQNDLLTGEGMMEIAGNKTILGAGSGVALNFGFTLTGDNVIIRNLDIMNGGFNTGDSEGLDCITCNARKYVWIDHCNFHEAMDGCVDPTKGSRFVTISYCYFYYQKTCILIGSSDSDSSAKSAQSNTDKSQWLHTVTLHHNLFDNVYERSPRVRYGAVHLFNNYISNCPTYAVGRGVGANIYSENNYFYNTTQVWKAWDTTSNPGYIDDVGSIFEGTNGDTTDNPPTGDWVWTPSQYYSYTPHTAQWVKDNLKNYAGVGKSNP